MPKPYILALNEFSATKREITRMIATVQMSVQHPDHAPILSNVLFAARRERCTTTRTSMSESREVLSQCRQEWRNHPASARVFTSIRELPSSESSID